MRVSRQTLPWRRGSKTEPATSGPAAPVPASVPSGSALQASWASGWGTSGLSPICTAEAGVGAGAGAGAAQSGRATGHERSQPPAPSPTVPDVSRAAAGLVEGSSEHQGRTSPTFLQRKCKNGWEWKKRLTWMSTSYSHSSTNGESTVSSAAECGRGTRVVNSERQLVQTPAPAACQAQLSVAWLVAHTKQQQRALQRVQRGHWQQFAGCKDRTTEYQPQRRACSSPMVRRRACWVHTH